MLFRSDRIKLNIGKRAVTFLGYDLHINSLTTEGAVVQGTILSVEFSDAD